jgi:copper(I)-binding protein
MKTFIARLLFVTVSLAVPGSALAEGFKVGTIEIDHLYSRAMLPGAKVGGGYLSITNTGAEDRLVSATAERAGTVQLHEMKIDGGIMVMRELKDGIAVPAHSTVELKPGGYHVMFMKVSEGFKEGEEIKATLTFEKAGSVEVEFKVGPAAGSAAAVSHDEHADAHAHHKPVSEASALTGDPQHDIPAKLKSIFETPDKTLSVAPVVVEGDWAIAGWTQDARGGRALLKKKGDGWSIHLCSGDGLKDPDALKTMGLSDADATSIAAKLAEAEKHIAPETLALFASFEGTVMVEGGDASAHGEHEGHAK